MQPWLWGMELWIWFGLESAMNEKGKANDTRHGIANSFKYNNKPSINYKTKNLSIRRTCKLYYVWLQQQFPKSETNWLADCEWVSHTLFLSPIQAYVSLSCYTNISFKFIFNKKNFAHVTASQSVSQLTN